MRRHPKLTLTAISMIRVFQPRFTAGVVGVLLNNADEVLLVEHVFHSKQPWGLPGGWVNRNELLTAAVEREFHEETGLIVKTLYPLSTWSSPFWRNHIDMAFAVELLDNSASHPPLKLSRELLSYEWLNRADLPRLFAEHVHVIDLALAYRHSRNVPPPVK
ncbi:MAG: NUDIX hydrolase [Chloroflexi bacterium]|nr:NUDIX hydrolase [Chloroflexota bacterium]